MINKRSLMALAVAPLIDVSAQQGVYVDQRPNIILFMVDDMGWQDTSLPFCEEKTPLNRRYHTPNMERLASEGMMLRVFWVRRISGTVPTGNHRLYRLFPG